MWFSFSECHHRKLLTLVLVIYLATPLVVSRILPPMFYYRHFLKKGTDRQSRPYGDTGAAPTWPGLATIQPTELTTTTTTTTIPTTYKRHNFIVFPVFPHCSYVGCPQETHVCDYETGACRELIEV